jgi:hypothetical protein
MQSARETVEKLRPEYEKFSKAAAHFVEVVDEAKRREPRLAALEAGKIRIGAMEHNDMSSRFIRYRSSSEDRDKVNRMFGRCRKVFAAKVWSEALTDPNRAGEIRPALILLYRSEMRRPSMHEQFIESLKTCGLAVFDPNDPDEDRLWENIKRHEIARSHSLGPARQKILKELEEEGIGRWFAEHAGQHDFSQVLQEWLEIGFWFYTPEEVYQAKKQFEEAEDRMGDIYPWWGWMRRILMKNAEDEAIINTAYGYNDTWPDKY